MTSCAGYTPSSASAAGRRWRRTKPWVARRAERKKEREQLKADKEAEKEKKRLLRRERLAALGEDSDLEDDESESDGTESEQSSDGEDEVAERGEGLNWFGNAFQQAIEETGVRVKADSFEHCVVEVKKDDLLSFLERACTIMRLQLSKAKA